MGENLLEDHGMIKSYDVVVLDGKVREVLEIWKEDRLIEIDGYNMEMTWSVYLIMMIKIFCRINNVENGFCFGFCFFHQFWLRQKSCVKMYAFQVLIFMWLGSNLCDVTHR